MKENDKKTSEEWYKLLPKPTIMDPDGWDRSNYQFSWYEEKITFPEFEMRRMASTCLLDIPKDKPMSKRLYTKEEVAAILRYRHNATTVMDEYQAIREWEFGKTNIEGAKKHLEDMRKNGIRGGDKHDDSKVIFKEPTEFYDGKKHDKHFEDESPMVLKPSIEKKWGAKLNLTPDEREKIRESTGTTNPETENNEDGSWNYKPETVNPWDVVTDEDFDRAISGLSLIDALKEEE